MKFNSVKSDIAERTRTTNHEGGEAFEPEDPRLKLYKRTINNLLEDTFYEDDEAQFEGLKRAFEECAEEHSEFTLKLAYYAREEMFLRQIPQLLLVFAANHENTQEYVREYATGVMQRADEPLEVLAMQVKLFGKSIPNPLQQGIEDALHTFDEYEFAKYDSDRREFSYRDLLNLVHPKPRDDLRDELFERIVLGELDDHPDVEPLKQHRTWETERSSDTTTEEFTFNMDETSYQHKGVISVERCETDGEVELEIGDEAVVGEEQATIKSALVDAEPGSEFLGHEVEADPEEETITVTVEADLTEADEYRQRLPDMGLMGKIRNVRNMLDAGLDAEEILTGEDLSAVPYVDMFPFRYYQAYKAVKDAGYHSDHLDIWFENAIDKSLAQIPEEFEDTYVASDTSGSMTWQPISEHSTLTPMEIGALFGGVCASKGAKTSAFASRHQEIQHHADAPVLSIQDTIKNASVGGDTHGYKVIKALRTRDESWDNITLFTDMQLWGGSLKNEWDKYKEEVNPDANLYIVDLASYGDLVLPEGYDSVYRISGWNENIVKHIRYASEAGEAIQEVESMETPQ